VPRSRIDELLERQAYELDRLTRAQAKAVLAAYEDARRELLERLNAQSSTKAPANTQRLRVMLAQTTEGIAALQARLGRELEGAELAAHTKSMRHLLKLVRAAEPRFRDAGGAIEVGIVKRLATRRAQHLHRKAVRRYGADVVAEIHRALAAGVAAGLTQPELAARVAAAGGSVLAQHRGRAELIARMETARAYNDGVLDGIREIDEADRRPDDPLLKRIDEFFDLRNHPFSRAAHGKTAAPGEPFRVAIAEVKAAAETMKRGVGGVVWRKVGANYVGDNLPAHFGERGRIVAWRASWGIPG
jgi:hypothetical protein